MWLQSHTHTQPFYGCLDFVQDNPGEPVPEETFTHSHSLWSSIILICFLHLLRSMASSIFNPHALQSFTQSLSKFSLVYLLAWHPPLHTPYISSPNHYVVGNSQGKMPDIVGESQEHFVLKIEWEPCHVCCCLVNEESGSEVCCLCLPCVGNEV